MKRLLHSTFYILHSCRRGQSLIEVLVAVAIGSLLVVAAASIIAPALRINTQAFRVQTGVGLGKELLENVRVWSESDWHNFSTLATGSTNHFYLNTASSPFASSSGDESVVVSTTTYKRYFYLDDVSRDAGDLIATGGTLTLDPSTKKITVSYSWPQSATFTISEYLTRNRSNIFWQTDWSRGPGQEGPATTTNSKFSTSTNIDYTTSTGSIYIKFP